LQSLIFDIQLCHKLSENVLIVTVQHPDGRQMQMNLTGFLNAKNTRTFIQELWELLVSAQENIGGIPAVFLEQKKEEIKMRQVQMIFMCKYKSMILCRFSFARVVGYWRGYLSGARCRLAYGPADATATHCLLLQ